MKRNLIRAIIAGVALCADVIVADPASAHSGTGLAGGFAAGFVHPFGGLDHALAMVSVGLWGAFLGRPLIYALPVIFPAMMAAGAIAGMFGAILPPTEIGIAISVLVLGGCVALALKAPAWAAVPIVAVFAIFHGYAHGIELPSAAAPAAYCAGFVLATGLLHLFGIGIGFARDWPGGRVLVRGFGALICAAGTFYLAGAVGP